MSRAYHRPLVGPDSFSASWVPPLCLDCMPSINFITTLWLSPIVGLLFKERVSYKPCGLYEDPVSLFFFFPLSCSPIPSNLLPYRIISSILLFCYLSRISYLISHSHITYITVWARFSFRCFYPPSSPLPPFLPRPTQFTN